MRSRTIPRKSGRTEPRDLPNTRRLVATLMVPTLTTIIMIAMFAVAVPFIRAEYSLSPDATSWLLIAYTLPNMMLMPLYGRLGDGLGKRRLLLGGVILFVAGTGLLASVRTFPLILLARAIQGAGAASVNPLAMAMIIELVRPQRRGKALGTWNSGGPIAGFLGPLIAGAIIDALGWRSIFVPALIIGVAAIVIIALMLPESERRVPLRQLVRSFDWTGVALFNGAVAMLVFYTSSRPITGFDPFTDLRFLVSGIVLLVGFLWWSRRRANPFVDLSIFRGRNFTMASTAVSLRMVLRGGTGFLLPLLVADLYDFSAAAIGALLMLDAGALLITMWVGGIVIDRRKSRLQIVVGLAVEAAAMLGFVLLWEGAPVALIFVILAMNALGAGYCLAALHLYAMTGVAPEQSATAAGLYSMIRFAGAMLGPAIGGVVLSAGVDQFGLSAAGYRPAFVFLLVVSVIGAVSALGLTRRVPESASETTAHPA